MGCLRNSHNDSTRGEIRLTLHLKPFCRTCGITESWAALAWLNDNKRVRHQTSQRPARSGVAKAKERHRISSLRACQHNLCTSQMLQNARSCHSQIFHRAPYYCQLHSELLSLRVPPEVQALERGRDANDNHDSDAMKSSGSMPCP